MDTSPEFVKMCEKAVELQDGEKPGTYGADIIYQGDLVFAELGRGTNDLRWVRLFRQGQLQEMMKGYIYPHQKLRALSDICFNRFSHLLAPYWEDFTSGEQLWLAFVMKGKFGKVWTGQDWQIGD